MRSVGLDLLPGAGELQPRCSCPDWAAPCKHAAAVCFLVADALDADPFGVLLLRGLGREEVLAGLEDGWLPARADFEYARPIEPGPDPALVVSRTPDELRVWMLGSTQTLASARLTRGQCPA